MRAVRIAVIVALGYVGVVVVFESLLGLLQPAPASTLVITTFDPSRAAHDRVLSRLESGGRLYVAANHWPRAWYNNALENPRVRVTMDGTTADYIAVPVDDAEHERVAAEIGNGIAFKIMVGFAPQRFLRLDPVESR